MHPTASPSITRVCRRGLAPLMVAWLMLPSTAVAYGETIAGPGIAGSASANAGTPAPQMNEGKYQITQITAGPFDIHRKYRSMEGPWAAITFRVGDLILSGRGDVPEAKIHYVESGNKPLSMTTMTGIAAKGTNITEDLSEDLSDLIDTSKLPRTLCWFKGMKVEVLDENDKPLRDGEFICHSNLEIDSEQHDKIFPEGERSATKRLVTLTQGETEVMLPPGFGFPCASDEKWRLALQAANRTTDRHRRLKQRATLYFIKDSELEQPITALHPTCEFVSVVVDRSSEGATSNDQKSFPHCDVLTNGVNAPNNVIGGTFDDGQNRRRSGHWIVPSGVHKYSNPLNEVHPGFADKPQKLRAAWVHIHPLCTKVTIKACNKKTPVFEADITTKTEGGLQITKIDPHVPLEGILFPKHAQYQLEGLYENTLEHPVDSMVSVGLYFEDNTFARPTWALPDHPVAYCGGDSCRTEGRAKTEAPSHSQAPNQAVSHDEQSGAQSGKTIKPIDETLARIPLFDPKTDGPLLNAPARFVVTTTSGDLHLVLDPAAAPATATQIARLFAKNGYVGTRFRTFQPGYLLQISPINDKGLGASVSSDIYQLVRRLPLETTSSPSAAQINKPAHHKYALSLSRFENEPLSGSTSFSILLGDAPHLDGHYTVFGYLEPDEVTNATIQRITSDWESEQPLIVSTKAANTR